MTVTSELHARVSQQAERTKNDVSQVGAQVVFITESEVSVRGLRHLRRE